MKTTIVVQGENLVDVGLRQTGDAEGLFAVARLNGLTLNDGLVPDQTLVVPDLAIDAGVVRHFDVVLSGRRIATGERELAEGGSAFDNGFNEGFS
jgi:hypothetical protein